MISRRRFLQTATVTTGVSLTAFTPSLRAEEPCRPCHRRLPA